MNPIGQTPMTPPTTPVASAPVAPAASVPQAAVQGASKSKMPLIIFGVCSGLLVIGVIVFLLTSTSTSKKQMVESEDDYTKLPPLPKSLTTIEPQDPNKYFIYGTWTPNDLPVEKVVKLQGGIKVYIAQDGNITKMVGDDGTAKFYEGSYLDFDPNKWSTYGDAQGNYKLKRCPPKCMYGCDASGVCNLKAKFYEYCDYDGVVAELPVGEYGPKELRLPDNSISSVKVPQGLKVVLYDNDNKTGPKLELTSDVACLMINEFNNITSRIVITEI